MKSPDLLRPCRWLVATRSRRRALVRVGLVVVLVPLLLQLVLAYLLGGDARLLPPELLRAKNLLLVTAHPDDECLFFAPSVLGVLDRNHAVKGSLLVMSTGTLCFVCPACAETNPPILVCVATVFRALGCCSVFDRPAQRACALTRGQRYSAALGAILICWLVR